MNGAKVDDIVCGAKARATSHLAQFLHEKTLV